MISPNSGKGVTVDALVDTGATFTVLPTHLAEDLKLSKIGERRVKTASGEEILTESYLILEVEGERTTSPVLLSPKIDRVLLGALTLEALALKVDPKTGKLEKTELLLL